MYMGGKVGMIYKEYLEFFSTEDVQLINITEEVEKVMARSNITSGVAFILSNHTTTGITINEPLECVEKDIKNTLERLIPENSNYIHAHFLPSYGATSNNSPGHLKSSLLGNHAMFSVENGKLEKGSAQDIYLVECDGPQTRKILIKILGE